MFLNRIAIFIGILNVVFWCSVQASEDVVFDKEFPRDLIAMIQSMKSGQFIGCAMFSFTDLKMVQALCDAKNRGVLVRVSVSERMMGMEAQRMAVEQWRRYGVKVIVVDNLHAKMWLFADSNPEDGVVKNPIGFIGSSNATNNAYRNYEIMYKNHDLRLWVDTYNKFLLESGEQPCTFTSFSTPTKKIGLFPFRGTDTPPTNTVVSSVEADLNRLVAHRITTTPSEKIVCGMSVTSSPLVQALKDAGNSASVVVDKSQLKSAKGRDILKELDVAGVNTRVHMGSCSGYLHAKSVTRSSDSVRGAVACISTGNFTDMGNSENNGFVATKNPLICSAIQDYNRKIFDEAKPLSEISPSKFNVGKKLFKSTSKKDSSDKEKRESKRKKT